MSLSCPLSRSTCGVEFGGFGMTQLESGAERETVIAKRGEAAITKSDSAQLGPSVNAMMNDLHRAAGRTDDPATWIKVLEGEQRQPLAEMLEKVLGVEGRSFASRLFSEAIGAEPLPDANTFREIAQALASLKPEGGDQAMLVAQMVGIHRAAMRALRMAGSASATEDVETLTNRAIKLMRLFATQVELMARLQGTISQQRIVVEKVDVRDGGQAAIGVLSQGGGGRG